MSTNPHAPVQMTFSINRCECVHFELAIPKKKDQVQLAENKYNFNFSFKFDVNEEKRRAIISVSTILLPLDFPDNSLAKLDAIFEFFIVNFNEIIIPNSEGILAINDPLLATLLAVSISSLRGMFAIKLADTSYANAIIPVLDANKLLPKIPVTNVG